MRRNRAILIGILVVSAVIGFLIYLQYPRFHDGGVLIAELNVKTIDANGNPVATLIMVSEPFNGGWRVIKEQLINASGTFEFVGLFAPSSLTGYSYRIDGMTPTMDKMGTVMVNLANGRNDITLPLSEYAPR
jgi:hypothetical protein